MSDEDRIKALADCMRAASIARGEDVRCPVCNAGIGRRCLPTIHPERIERAREAAKREGPQ